MGRLKAGHTLGPGPAPRDAAASGMVSPVNWQGILWVYDKSQQIGRFDRAPLTGQPTAIYSQYQRRNGWADVDPHWSPYVVAPNGALPWQQTQQPTALYTQFQRRGGAHRPLSRIDTALMMGNVAQAQIAQGANNAYLAQAGVFVDGGRIAALTGQDG